MNPILETLYPDDGVLAKRQSQGYPPLEPSPDSYTQYLHLEMWLCYLHGLDHAAVVMACALTDAAVKICVYLKAFVGAECQFEPAVWDKIEGSEFGNVINLAKSKGIVTKDEWEHLEWLRKHIRNVYMHGATPEWLKDKEMDGVVQGDLNTGEVSEVTVKLREDLSLQREARIRGDRNTCNQLIPMVDSLVRAMSKRAVEHLEGWKAKNPSTTTRAQVDQVLDNMHKMGLKVDRVIARDFPPDMTNQAPNAGRRPDKP